MTYTQPPQEQPFDDLFRPQTNLVPVFNVRAYGADPYGINDSTNAIQAAINAAASPSAKGGTVHLPQGTFLVSAGLTVTLATNAGIQIVGAGIDATTIKVANASFVTSGLLFNLSGAAVFGFHNLTLDLNGTNQTWTASTSTNFYKAISADANNGATNGATLLIGTLKIKNASMSATVPNGLGVNTFGCSTWDIGTLLTEACDFSLFVTQAFSTTPNRGSFRTIIAHNHNNAVVQDEGGFGGPGWCGGAVISHLDSLCGAGVPADALRVGVGAASSGINLDRLLCTNGRYPINVGGNGLSDSNIGKCVAVGCRGTYNLQSADGSCSFAQLIADGCAIGGITGVSVFGSFELGNISGDGATIQSLICNNSQNQAIQGFGGPVRILGGRVKNGTTSISINTPQGSVIRNVEGINPKGDEGSPSVPASGTPLTNPFPFDCEVFVTAAAGGTTTVTLMGVNVQTIAATAEAMYIVPAGATIQYNYGAGNAPSHHWLGM